MYNIITAKETALASKAADVGKEKDMDEEMNQAEVAREETEQKMLYKFITMIDEAKEKSETLDDLKEKIKALITK